MRIYVVDLFVLLEAPGILKRMVGEKVVIPLAVLDALDALKNNKNEEQEEAAKKAISALFEVSKSLTALIEGVKTPYGVTVQVVKEYASAGDLPDSLKNRTIETALLLQGRGHDVTVLTRKESVKSEANKRLLKALIVEKEQYKESKKGGDNMERTIALRKEDSSQRGFKIGRMKLLTLSVSALIGSIVLMPFLSWIFVFTLMVVIIASIGGIITALTSIEDAVDMKIKDYNWDDDWYMSRSGTDLFDPLNDIARAYGSGDANWFCRPDDDEPANTDSPFDD